MPNKGRQASVKFHFEKGKHFRVVHVDGALGGCTPTREIFVSLYNQRSAIPRLIEQELLPNGQLGEEVHREGKEGIFREMEIGLVMTPMVAEEIAKFLLTQVKLLNETSPTTAVDARLRKSQ